MSIKTGIVGLPNVGKSTLFNALTESNIEAENYPFCTIEPNHGMVKVNDDRLDKINQFISTEKISPSFLEFVDIAGLVKGASEGEGLGNQFLSNIRNVDAIIHVVRCFDDENITHVENSISPIRDIEIINTELLLKDIETISKRISKIEKTVKSGNKEFKAEYDLLVLLMEELNNGQLIKNINLDIDQDHRLTLTRFYGDDVLDFSYEDPVQIISGDNVTVQQEFQFGLDWPWGNKTNGLTWRWIISPKIIAKTFLSSSRYRFDFDLSFSEKDTYTYSDSTAINYANFNWNIYDMIKDGH